jgi:hypothetical protein
MWGDEYVGWPPDFYIHHVRLLATHVASARFPSFVAPIAAGLMQAQNTTNCTGG